MKRASVYVIAIIVLVVAWRVIRNNFNEFSAAMWHAKHGSHAEIRGIRIIVPLSYEVQGPNGMAYMSLIKSSSQFQKGFGVININFHQRPSPETMRLLPASPTEKQETEEKVSEQAATFAGKTGTCTEYIPKFLAGLNGAAGINDMTKKLDFHTINCWFNGEVEVTFMGSADQKDNFYRIIKSAAPVTRKS